MARHKWSNVVLLIVSLAVSVALAETACRFLLPRPGFVPRGSDDIPGLWVQHQVRGYTYASNFAGTMTREDFTITVKTNDLGLRVGDDRRSMEEPRTLVLAVGDSFTFGWGVEYEQAWPAKLEAELNRSSLGKSVPTVVNAGVSGYSLHQIGQLTLELVQKWKPKVVVIGVYLGAADRLLNPFVLFNGGLVRRNSVPQLRGTEDGYLFSPMYRSWVREIDFWLDERFVSAAYAWKGLYEAWEGMSQGGPVSAVAQMDTKPVPEGAEIQLLLEELDSIRTALSGHDTRPVILSIVGQNAEGQVASSERRSNDRLMAWCKQKDVECVEVLPSFDSRSGGAPVFRFKNDPHWSPLAHHVAAQAIAAHVQLTAGK